MDANARPASPHLRPLTGEGKRGTITSPGIGEIPRRRMGRRNTGGEMARRGFGALTVGLVLVAGLAWALTDADSGALWVQARSRQKIQVANILSRELGGDPWKYVQCLDKIFTDPANARMTIRDAAERCKAQQ
jgi:hypothetical protein